jgi:hypothetical protein
MSETKAGKILKDINQNEAVDLKKMAKDAAKQLEKIAAELLKVAKKNSDQGADIEDIRNPILGAARTLSQM